MTTEQVVVVLDDSRLGAPVEVGLLSHDRKGSAEVVRFSYTQEWLRAPHAFPIDPELALYPGDQFPGDGRALFGILRDTSPDRWGRILMERREALEAKAEQILRTGVNPGSVPLEDMQALLAARLGR